MLNLWQDLRYGVRTLTKQPGFALLAVFTLSLGIGANSAIFSVIQGVLLKPLAFPHSEQVVKLWEAKAGGFQGTISAPNLQDWRAQQAVFTRIAAFSFISYSLAEPGRAAASARGAGFAGIL